MRAECSAVDVRRAVALALAVVMAVAVVAPPAVTHASQPTGVSDRVERHRAWEAEHDKQDIRATASMRRDESRRMLVVPTDLPDAGEFSVAQEPPMVDFAIVQHLEPRYMPEAHELEGDRGPGNWAGWGDTRRGPEGAFYFALGNHVAYGGDARIIRYDPRTREQSLVLSAKEVVGWGDEDFGEGKLHGYIDISPDGEMWLLTLNGPEPTEEEWATRYRGGWLIHHDLRTGESRNLGVPLEGGTWPYHAWDWRRGILFAVGHEELILVYDTDERRVRYGGPPREGIHWFHRVAMLDRDSGIFYGTEAHRAMHWFYRSAPSTEPHHFLRYETRNNHFTVMEAAVPANPQTGRVGPVRAHTDRKDSDGAFWCLDYYGTLFRFYPEADRTSEALGFHWGAEGIYTTSIVMSPDERYLYYVPGAQAAGRHGFPVVQYDTRSGTRKVLAFLRDYYLDEYGYHPAGTYGLAIDEAGESLFFYANGRFLPEGADRATVRAAPRRPAMFHMHIPESERSE